MNSKKRTQLFSALGLQILMCSMLFLCVTPLYGQETQKVNKEFASGNLIHDVRIILLEGANQNPVSAEDLEDFYNAFFIKPGTTFNPIITDLAMSRIVMQDNVKNASYELYDSKIGSGTVNRSLRIIIYVQLLGENESKSIEKGILTSKNIADFPIIYESNRAQFKFFLNGGLGIYNDENALFGKGKDFTIGNSIADNPAGNGTRFWMETYLEPGISGISQLGNSNFYWYGEASLLVSLRNTTDIYSSGSAAFLDVERLNTGFLAAGIGKKKNITVNANYGRNFFQLNDGFLFARTSGSANAGFRASAYSSARTAFEKNGNLVVQWDKFRFSGHFVEPQELFKNKQLNTNYAIGTFNYNNSKNLDVGISYISTTGGNATYKLPIGTIDKKGMYVINPKLWLSNIANTGLFFKSEFAYQSHTTEDMQAYSWYTGLGLNLTKLKTTPMIYYRYAYLQGDDPTTQTYERFDPILTGGLGNWVQGLDFRKVLGNGNIVSHRVELTSWITKSMAISLDYFYLQSDQLNNLGGLSPISNLKSKELGHETSLTLKGMFKEHYTILGIVSYAIPGSGIKEAFLEKTNNWLTVQAALFINF